MTLVLIASDSHATGQAIAERTVAATGYSLADRSILPQVAGAADIDVEQLVDALDGRGFRLGRASRVRKRGLRYVERATLGLLTADDVVSHGLGAHRYVKGVSHAMRLLVRTGEESAEARRTLFDSWIGDPMDPAEFDLVVDLEGTDLDRIVDDVVATTRDRRFQRITYSEHILHDLELASRVRVRLLPSYADAQVKAVHGTIVVEVKAGLRNSRQMVEEIKRLVAAEEGVDYVEVHVLRPAIRPR